MSSLAQQPKLMLPIGHPQGITDILVSEDGKYLVSESFNDIHTKIWDTRTGKLLHDINIVDGSLFVKLSPSGKHLFISGRDSSFIFNVCTGNFDLAMKQVFNGVSYSANGDFLLTNKDTSLQIWNPEKGQLLHTYFSKDTIASASYINHDRNILVEKKSRGQSSYYVLDSTLHLIRQLNFPVQVPGYFSEFRDCLYVTQFDGQHAYIRQLDYDSLKIRTTCMIDSIGSKPSKFSFSKFDGNLLVGMEDSSLHLFNINDGLIYSFNKFKYGFDNVSFVDSGRHFVMSDDYWAVYFDTKEGNVVQQIDYFAESRNLKNVEAPIIVNNQLKKFYFVLQDNVIREYKIQGDTSMLSQLFRGETEGIDATAFSKELIFLGDGNGYIKFMDIGKAEVTASYDAHPDYLSDLSYSSHSHLILSTSIDSTLKLWDPATRKEMKKIVRNYPILTADVNDQLQRAVIVSSDLIITRNDKANTVIEVFDLMSNKTINSIKSNERIVSGRFSNDGKFIFYCNQSDSTTVICDITLRPLRKIKSAGWEFDARQSQNGKYIEVLTDISVELYDYNTGKLYRTFAIDNRWGYHRFSIDKSGTLLAAGSGRGGLLMWDLESGRLLFTAKAHASGVVPCFIDSSRLITSSEDGTIKYWKYDRQNLYPVSQTVPFKFNEYITTIPSGYYKGSRNASRQLHYVTSDSRIISFEQLDVKYNRPDKVLEAIGNTDTVLIKSYRKAYEKRIKKLRIDTTAFRDGYSVPEADFVSRDNIEYEQKNEKLKLRFKGADSTCLLDRFNVWVNEVPVFGLRGFNIKKSKSNNIDTTITITLSQGENRIETSITNINGIESYRMPLFVNYSPAVKEKEITRFIGIGIDQFADSKYNLRYSAKDIRDLSVKLKQKYGEAITIDTLFNSNVTVSNVKALKQKLQQTTVNDKVIIAYSGHGLLSKDYDYYLSTYNVNFENPEQKGLPYDELESLLDSIPARKKLMLIDACHSGEVDKEELTQMQKMVADNSIGTKGSILFTDSSKKRVGIKNSFELMQELFVNVGKSTGATVISAAAGTQFALERGDLKNGVFTYSLIEAMNKYPQLKVSELKRIVGARVEELTNGLQKPTSRNEVIAVDWEVW
ncbi:caspase family protein [Solitalea longa]|nr:caspase family protein [Solitalea longa]